MTEGPAKHFDDVWERIVPVSEPGAFQKLLICVACLAAAIVLRLPFEPSLKGFFPYTTFFPALLAATLLAGGIAGALVLAVACPIALILFGSAAASLAPVAAAIIWLLNGGVVLIFALGVRQLVRKQRESRAALEASQQKLTTMLHEFDHRTRNAFSLIQAISNQTAKSARSINDYKDRLHDRISTLAAAKTWLLTHPGEAVGLETVVDMALRPFLDERAGQIDIRRGPDCLVAPSFCTSLTLALHELATNAAKYGALSTPQGRVVCTWENVDEQTVKLTWREEGGPPVEAPAAAGFGSTLIRNAFSGEASGVVSLDFPPSGVVCEIRFTPAEPCAVEPALAV